MKLQRLELFGFKSFADRVAIEFNPGITAIVGPNGCGKSNVSDAIRWVLGEQRPTLVRGSKMEEVIFNGSSNRKPINLAEVTLHFANGAGTLPVDYSEVAIARRVFREGDSEYFMNKQSCRLKDIQDLFMGTGIGTHTYSLIQQGMVDSVLSHNTEERRYLFEEAAGVTRYKTRRRATERKLEATTHDLERVGDIVAEVGKTVRSLKRQVGKARRFLSYQAEETRLDAHLTSVELETLALQEAPLVERLRTLAEGEAEEAAQLAEREASLETLELRLVEDREKERIGRAAAEEIRNRIGRRENSRLVMGETLKHNADRLEALSREDEASETRGEELVRRREKLETDRREAATRLEGVKERLQGSYDASSEEAHYAELKVERGRLLIDVEEGNERVTEARQTAARQGSVIESAELRLSTLAKDLVDRKKELEEAEASLERERAEVASQEASRESAMKMEEDGRSRVREAHAERDALREQLAAARAAEQAVESRYETLSSMENRYEGYTDGAQALLDRKDSIEGLLGALPQAVEARETRFETAIDRYLESLGHALLVRDRSVAEESADRLAEENGGRADFLVPDLLVDGPVPDLPDRAAAVVVARGLDAIRWTGEEPLGRRLESLFTRLLLVRNRTDAFRCREALDGEWEAARHYVVVGLDGTMLEPTGRWRTAGVVDEDGPLSLRRRCAEAKEEMRGRTGEVERLGQGLEAAERDVQEAEAILQTATEAVREAEAGQRTAREALVVVEETRGQAQRRVEEIQAQLDSQREERDRARAAIDVLERTLEDAESDVDRAKSRLEDVQTAIDRYDAARLDRQSARHAVELELAEEEAALRAVDRELEHLESAEDELDSARVEREVERSRLEAANIQLEEERVATAEEIQVLYSELDAAQEELRESGERTRDAETLRSTIENETRGLRQRHQETIEDRHQVELAHQELEHRRQTLLDHLSEAYEKELVSLLEEHPLEEEERECDLDELRHRLEEVRRKRANLGPVNMLAVEEYDSEAERLEFLESQRDDLVNAKRQLEEAIERINMTARELFLETFNRVAESFDETFRTLFEGGHAGIELVDPTAPLESPIEIVASPRGKRVQTINLLSGGERALTALSLLFAIYRVKPSPFCIFDEVDAALDDANVGRFLNMIRFFSEETQFVIITHNKRTMEAADYLYGITMEEPGVSTLVSVSIDEADATTNGGSPDAQANGRESNGRKNGGDQNRRAKATPEPESSTAPEKAATPAS